MKKQSLSNLLLVSSFTLLISILFTSQAKANDTIKVLLVGDSTTKATFPRLCNPTGPHLEDMIELLAEAQGDLPKLNVINAGKGGATATSILTDGHYDAVIAPLKDIDYIFVRMGINDWFKIKDLAGEFPDNLKRLISRLQKDHPKALIIPSTICRFGGHEKCVDINNLIKNVATDLDMELFDLYKPYNQFLIENGENSLNARNCPLSKIPVKYHKLLKPYTQMQKGRKGKPDSLYVRVDSMQMDPILGTVKQWFYDRHPNTAGYNLIAYETINYLAPILRKRSK